MEKEELVGGSVSAEMMDKVDRAINIQLWNPVTGYKIEDLDAVYGSIAFTMIMFIDLAQAATKHPWKKS